MKATLLVAPVSCFYRIFFDIVLSCYLESAPLISKKYGSSRSQMFFKTGREGLQLY